MPLDTVRAVLVGHSHYDHIGDLPPILLHHVPGARVYVNRSGRNMLAAFPALDGRVVELDDRVGQWIGLEDDAGNELPIRFMPLESDHARHMKCCLFAGGEVDRPWDEPWTEKSLRKMKQGKVVAFVVDLLSPDRRSVRFRIHYQDSAGLVSTDYPPRHPGRGRGQVDLAVLCMPGHWFVDGYPEVVMQQARARHALVIHYEDFLRPAGEPTRFVALLSDGRANEFLERIRAQMSRDLHDPAGPASPVCGPSAEAWTMPLPGEWMRFPAE